MSKGLEELELIKELNVCKSTSNIEKELIALEIIKNKRVDCWAFISDLSVTSEEEIEYAFSKIDLTKEEYNLLKEVLL